jgi:hypothetical protein
MNQSLTESLWIWNNTKGCKTVVELGAGRFYKLSLVHVSVKKRIGIEIFKDYFDNPSFLDCDRILGDVRDFETLLKPEDMDCAFLIDVIEHLPKNESMELLRKVTSRFNRLLLTVPEGNHPQTERDGNGYQRHVSSWTMGDLRGIFPDESIVLIPDFHQGFGIDPGAIFVTWSKEPCELQPPNRIG